jgi:hypothetical protein
MAACDGTVAPKQSYGSRKLHAICCSCVAIGAGFAGRGPKIAI